MLSPIQVLCSDITTLSLEPEPFASYTEGVCSILFYPEGHICFPTVARHDPSVRCKSLCVCAWVWVVGCESVCVIKYVCVRSLSQVNSHMSLGAINISNITLSLSVCLILFCLSLFLSLLLYFCLSMSVEVWIECVWLISLNSLTRRHPISFKVWLLRKTYTVQAFICTHVWLQLKIFFIINSSARVL